MSRGARKSLRSRVVRSPLHFDGAAAMAGVEHGRRSASSEPHQHGPFSPVKVPPKKGAAVVEIAFSIEESALGAVLIARSADAVCAILIGSEGAELEGDLATQFTDSKLVRNDRKLSGDL